MALWVILCSVGMFFSFPLLADMHSHDFDSLAHCLQFYRLRYYRVSYRHSSLKSDLEAPQSLTSKRHFLHVNMATNSSNITAMEEVGWQAAPLSRGTMEILWSCISVVVLITWTNFHPPVGVSRKQRMLTAITSTLFPELPALVALRDYCLAFHLRKSLSSIPEPNTWKHGWTLTKSFLVVKRGIRFHPYHRGHANCRTSSGQNKNTTKDNVAEPQIFQMLAHVGSIRYKDFPTSEEIHDKSKGDWIAKSIMLLQLLWTVVNIGCRGGYNFPISLLESLMLEWVVLGLIALIAWWKCPQNIHVPYFLPFLDHRELMAMSNSDHIPSISTRALHNEVTDQERDFWVSFVLFLPLALLGSCNLVFFGRYQWHSTYARKMWGFFTITYYLAAFFLVYIDFHVRFAEPGQYFQKKYEELLLLPTTESNVQNAGHCSMWQKLATGMGIYNVTELDSATSIWIFPKELGLKTLVVVVFVALFSQFARLVIALTAFSSAPRGIYDVPQTWLLEALAHVGG